MEGEGPWQERVQRELDKPTIKMNVKNIPNPSGVSLSCESAYEDFQLLPDDAASPKPDSYEIVFKHVRSESVFWDGKFSTQPIVNFQGTPKIALMPIERILQKYIPRDYYLTKEEDGGVVLINDRFDPINLGETFGSLFPPGKASINLFLRSREFTENQTFLTSKGSSFITGSRRDFFDSRISSTYLQEANCVQLSVQEASGRKILWNAKAKTFSSSVRLVFNVNELSGLKVEDVLSNVVATGYLENTDGVIEKRIWTDRVKVISLKDAIDVLFLSTTKCNMYLKYISSQEDQQWQDVIEAISMFTEKIISTDDTLRNFYQENNVLEEMNILKSKIQQDDRDEEDIEKLMKKLEPKLNLALSIINIIDSDGTVPPEMQSQSKSIVSGIMKKHSSKQIKFDLYSTTSTASGFSTDDPTSVPKKTRSISKPKFYDWW